MVTLTRDRFIYQLFLIFPRTRIITENENLQYPFGQERKLDTQKSCPMSRICPIIPV
jgi:hypothetical protein